MASWTAGLTAANSRDTTHRSWPATASSRTVLAVRCRRPPPKNRLKSATHFDARLAGQTTTARLTRRRRCISRRYSPAMMVLPVPGSQASRKRSRGWGSIAPYTAVVWWAYGRSCVEAIALDSALVAAAAIHRVHIPASTRAEPAAPSDEMARTEVVSPAATVTSCKRPWSSRRINVQSPAEPAGRARRTVAKSGAPARSTRTRWPCSNTAVVSVTGGRARLGKDREQAGREPRGRHGWRGELRPLLVRRPDGDGYLVAARAAHFGWPRTRRGRRRRSL